VIGVEISARKQAGMGCALRSLVKHRDPTDNEVEGYIVVLILILQPVIGFLLWWLGPLIPAMK